MNQIRKNSLEKLKEKQNIRKQGQYIKQNYLNYSEKNI